MVHARTVTTFRHVRSRKGSKVNDRLLFWLEVLGLINKAQNTRLAYSIN
jgi:hypothetical protein